MFYQLVNDCAESDQWPLCTSLQRTKAPKRAIRQIQHQLEEQQDKLFTNDIARTSLNFWEGSMGKEYCESIELRSFEELKSHLSQHLENKEKDPALRHIFLSAGNSQKPLNCTLKAFLFMCTYHQVLPEFLDMLFSFGEPIANPVAFHQPRCHQEYWPNTIDSSFATPELGRSGWETINCYKLSAMEMYSPTKKWVMRQMAVYHSFDFYNGRSFFITVKANHREIREQITSIRNSTVPDTLSTSFISSLETQLIGFNWSIEGWRKHIDVLEVQIRRILERINAMPISPENTDDLQFYRSFTQPTISEPASPTSARVQKASRQMSFSERVSSFFQGRNGSSIKGTAALFDADDQPEHEKAKENLEIKIGESVGRIEDLQEFPFAGLQRLNYASLKLKEAKLVMSLNARVLQQVWEYYKALVGSDNIPNDIKNNCAVEFEGFRQRMKYLESFLANECTRADTLMQILNDGKGMYDSILQYQNAEISKLFAMNAQSASMRMETSTKRMEGMTESMHEIAQMTERDTASMHVITFFALVFLPGTFLGVRLMLSSLRQSSPTHLTQDQSFFSTPIFEGKEQGGASQWSFNSELFWLFAKICFPLMVIILVLWALYMRWTKSRHQRREKNRVNRMC